MNPYVVKAIENNAGDPAQVFRDRALPNFGERIATRFKDFGKDFVQSGKNFAKIADRLDGSKPVILIINTIPYTFSNCHVEESYETSTDYQESVHPDSPPILIPNSHSLTLKIKLPIGREQDFSKYMVMKNAIRLQSLLAGTSEVLPAGGGYVASGTVNIYDSFRFGVFTGATPTPGFASKKKYSIDKNLKKNIKSCAKEKEIKFKEILTSEQKSVLMSCVSAKERQDKKEQEEEQQAIDDYKKKIEDASCAEEAGYDKLIKRDKDGKIIDDTDAQVLRGINSFNRKAFKQSAKNKLKQQPKYVRKSFRKKLGEFPWQIQVACAYFGRYEFMMFGTLIKFNVQNIPGTTEEIWEITLLGFNFRHDPRKKLYRPKVVTESVVHDVNTKKKSPCASVHEYPATEAEVNATIVPELETPAPTPDLPKRVNPKREDAKRNTLRRDGNDQTNPEISQAEFKPTEKVIQESQGNCIPDTGKNFRKRLKASILTLWTKDPHWVRPANGICVHRMEKYYREKWGFNKRPFLQGATDVNQVYRINPGGGGSGRA